MNKEKIARFYDLPGWSIRLAAIAFLSILFTVFASDVAYAGALTEADDIAENIVTSAEFIPGLITGTSYLLALLLGVLAILNFKNHVEQGGGSNGVALRKPVIQLLAGGALFALPIVYEAMETSIDAGAGDVAFDTTWGNLIQAASAVGGLGAATVPILGDANQVMENIVDGIENMPGIVTAASYLFGILLGVLGILKIKDHVENPDQTKLKDGIIRLLIGGALFALPSIYLAMYTTVADTGLDGASTATSGVALTFFGLFNPMDITNNCLFTGINGTVGAVLCSAILHTAVAPAFMASIAYLVGLVLGAWGLLKLRDHVENPQQTKLSEGLSRLIAGGLLFALPVITEVARNTIYPNFALLTPAHTSFNGYNDAGTTPLGLSAALNDFMDNLLAPATHIMVWFGYVAGVVLIFVAITRLYKSAQEGARGPGGFGTLMTFVAGGALISFNQMITAFSTSFFNNGLFGTEAYAELQYTTGMSVDEVAHAHIVISAILKFMIIVGFASFIRGIFIIRDVAEGKQQSSIMAGVTHMIGGSLAVNLGPLLNAVQATLGIVGFGVAFT
ncbi:MAG: hypothetical protein DHS20C02_14890 [Micavibrio sp.]|nr:MAG: hypothetical protein DHS20C02_14890 [Micavibrio sp.]